MSVILQYLSNVIENIKVKSLMFFSYIEKEKYLQEREQIYR